MPAIALADTACPSLTTLQKAAAYVSLENFLWVIGVVLLTSAILLIFKGIVAALLEQTAFIEVGLWVLTVGLIVKAYYTMHGHGPTDDFSSWALIIGSLLIPGAISFSAHVRKLKPNMTRFSTILTVVWGALAIVFMAPSIGFLTMAAVISLLGFSVVVTPLCYAFGYDDKDSIYRGTSASVIILILFTVYRAVGIHYPIIDLFQSGAFWLGSLAGFVGLLILSSRYYDRANYALMNVITPVVFIGFGTTAAIYGIRELTTMVGAFIIFFIADKIVEIKTDGAIALGIKLGVIGLMFYGAWHFVNANQAIVSAFFNV